MASSLPLTADTGRIDQTPGIPPGLDYFDLADSGMVVVDSTGRLLRANTAFARLVGRSRDELIGSTFFSITDPADVAANQALLQRLTTKKRDESTSIEKRYVDPDGSVIWVSLTIRPIFGADGSVVCFLGETVDITARKNAEIIAQRELRELEDAQRVAHLGSFEQDPQSGDLRISAELGRLLGIELDDVIPSAQLMEVVHPLDRERLGAAISACLTNHTPVDMEHRLLLADGTLRWVHSHGEWISAEPGGRDRVLGTVLDVTDLKVAERAAAAELAHLERAQEVAHIGSFERDPQTDLYEVSEEGRQLFGLATGGPVPATAVLERVHPDDLQSVVASMEAAARDHMPFDLEYRIVLTDGSLRWVHAKGGWMRRDDDSEERVVTTVLDITERKLVEEALAFEHDHDKLTNLANRSFFLEQVDRVFSAAEYQAKQIAVLLLDLDDFKTVNDSLGHALGDELLVDLSHRLVAAARADDTIARFGGDEFALLVTTGNVRQVAEQLALRIAGALRVPFTLSEHEVTLSVSIGIALSDSLGDSGALLRDADLAMYLAKKNGRGRYEIAASGMQEHALERLKTIADLHHGVEHEEFEVYYQAIVDSGTAALVGAEALVRWNHPARGLVPPAAFIEFAESSGLIVPIGCWVRHEACRQLAVWRRADLVDDAFYISVNLSPRQLGEATLVDNVARDLDDAGLPARALVLEVTETALMADIDASLARLQVLKATGLRLALDDYGTGYSSLARLSELPIDIIKIDKSFIDAITVDQEGRAIVQSVIDAATALEMVTVAEGVEDQEQREVLVAMGCTYIQGYLFSRPLSSVDIEPTLRTLQAPRLKNPAPLEAHRVSDITPTDKCHPTQRLASFAKVINLQHKARPQDCETTTDEHRPQSFGDGRTHIGGGVGSFRIAARALLSAPSLCINIFWGAALVSVAILAISKHWSGEQLLPLLIVIGTCICGFAVRLGIGSRLPQWTLYVDLLIAQLVCVTVVSVGDTAKLDFSAFFVWIVIYSAMYLRPLATLSYFIAACSEYALVLSFGPPVANPVTSWLMLFSSTAITTIVVFGVVSVLRAAGHEDPLTGLPNRRSFDERLSEEIERSRRSLDPLSVAMIDLDGFKAVNDQYGHTAGDELLRELARAWTPALREGGDFLARIGGDEFIVIAANSDDLGIRRVADRLVKSLPDRINCSIGTATWDRSEATSDLVHRADQKMYERKLRHRNEQVLHA